ncbi:MAG: DUF1653 domain-containing protein [Bacilli bacterium]|nr:DUF1653 domain-containing protein [Bacilli bacterium]
MERKIEIGKKYKHFKGLVVEVIALAKDSETLKDLVVYNHDGQTWVREYDEFVSEVDHKKYPDIKQKYRFEEIKEI